MTDVDGCARDPDAAYRANALGTQNVALACQAARCAMLYISTNEVFDGTKTEPYLEFDAPNPINAYGRSKLAGENVRPRLADAVLHRPHRVVVWQRRQSLCPQDDPPRRRGRTTCASSRMKSAHRRMRDDVAHAIHQLIQTGAYGVYHLVNDGVASRYDFACEILRLRRARPCAGRADQARRLSSSVDSPTLHTSAQFLRCGAGNQLPALARRTGRVHRIQ